MERKRVAVAFGGVSPEHEVSIISAHQVLAAMDRSRFDPVAIYVGKDSRWFTGGSTLDLGAYSDVDALRDNAVEVAAATAGRSRLRLVPVRRGTWFRPSPPSTDVDVVIPAFHGGAGESGGFQGLCEMHDVPYAGSGVMGSSVGMDKAVSKVLSRAAGIPVVDWITLAESDWAEREEACLDRLESDIGLPAVVKPARLGSSIGITIARERASLDAAIEEAFRYDSKIVVERAVENLREINCSVLGNGSSIRLSVLEEPVRSGAADLLSFTDKYQRGSGGSKGRKGGAKREQSGGMASLDRIIPAKTSPELETEVRDLAAKVFLTHQASGVVRIDFLVDESTGRVYFNEINTIPGSFSFYLWEPAGVDFTQLVTDLIEVALERHRDVAGRLRSYDVNLLSSASIQGLKGAKRTS